MILNNMSASFKFFFLLSSALFIAFSGQAQGNGRISGTVTNRSNLQLLSGISISLTPGGKSTVSDSLGNFRITGINPGSYSLSLSGIGFQPRTLPNIVITTGNETVLNIELEPAVTQLSDIVITNRKSTAKAATLENPLSVQRLTTEDIKANPGGNFDISKVIQSLPGVGGGVAGGSYRNDIIIRGGAPSENVFYLDGIEVPIINHFATQGSGGGPQGILNVSFIEDVKLSTSAFDARYDNALSSVFQFKQKTGNANRLQGNFRLSATEAAVTLDGPLSKKTTFLASARRSYLQLLFQAIDLPIRPNYWDFQFKTTTRINSKTTLNILGIGAIDEFSFARPKEASPEKLYVIGSNPLINQTSYTIGATLRRLIKNGYINLALSRNTLDNNIEKFIDNEKPVITERTLNITSNETENKLRLDVTNNIAGWKLSYGAVAQVVEFDNRFSQLLRPAVKDLTGNIIQPSVNINSNTLENFLRYGAFVQTGKRFLDDRLALSGGIRVDANTFDRSESNPLKQFSPRVSASYSLNSSWNISASYGIYYRLPSYTQMTYFNPNLSSVPPYQGDYIRSTHWVGGLEYLPSSATRFTIEGFYKKYSNYPVSISDGISLANKGNGSEALGNEPVTQNGKGKAYGIEFFAQQKLTNRIFGVFSYTYYRSLFTGQDGKYAPANWDNRQLISFTAGYKFNRNWELGLKFRYQGAAPYTPFNLAESRFSYLTLGTGIFDYTKINSLRLPAFHAADFRIDKKWNYKQFTLDLFLDVTNFYSSKAAGIPQYTFQRNADNTAFVTTDNKPIQQNGSNAIPFILDNRDGLLLPTIGLIMEF
jgi:hypothetical protein